MLRRGHSTSRTARIIGLRLENGVPVADVSDGHGNTYLGCRFSGLGGGKDAFTYAPPQPDEDANNTPDDSPGAEAIIALAEGGRGRASVQGTFPNPGMFKQISIVEPPDADSDYSDKIGLLDFATVNNGARILVTESGHLILDTATSGMPVHIELAGTAFLRISQDGKADERTLLAGVSRAYIDGLVDQINDLRTAVKALATWAKAAGAPSGGGPIVPAYVGSSGPATAADKTADDMVASAVRISAQSLADE